MKHEAMVRGLWIVMATLVPFGLMLSVGCGPSEEKRERLKAGDAFLEAKKASEAGNTEEAIAILTASLEKYPSSWSYFERAKLYLETDRTDEALADCDAALGMQPENDDVKWLQGEIRKPADKRFKGKNAKPPSTNK